MNPHLVLLAVTADTKGQEAAFVRDILIERGLKVTVLDTGILGYPRLPVDISRERVAAAAGTSIASLQAGFNRGAAIDAMSRGAATITRTMRDQIDGVFALGGSGNASIASAMFTEIPFGTPKILVSTVASGNTRPYVAGQDIVLVYPVVDIAGINSISQVVLRNAANGFAAMVIGNQEIPESGRLRVAASMFGVTTSCVDQARDQLDLDGFEVLVFHATGEGGIAMESLIDGDAIAGVLDVTTTELADELVGGVCAAGPRRLEAAGRKGVPQVVALGALDIVNFGPAETVPQRYRGRVLYRHNRATTLMRTNPQECEELGEIVAGKLVRATGPTALFVPLRGLSELDVHGGPFFDEQADSALFSSLREHLGSVETHWLDLHINDRGFALAMADRLRDMLAA
jgi:uncharacterized protein (UPF0261 family)